MSVLSPRPRPRIRLSPLGFGLGLLFLILCFFSFVHAGENWNHGKTEVNPSPSVFSLDRKDEIVESVRQPVQGSKTTVDEFKMSKLAFSDVYSSNMAFSTYSDNDQETYVNNDIKTVEKRSVEGFNMDEPLESKINIHSVSVVDNGLDAPATTVNNRIEPTNVAGHLANGEFYEKIRPTKSDDLVQQQDLFSKTLENQNYYGTAGEALRASARGRALPLPEPRSASDLDVLTHNTSDSHRSDKPSPDLHDIITGFVKLINGNVQVQVNPNAHPLGGRPLYPVRTRINNRGPPRITDVPPLEFDPPPPPRPPVSSKPSHPSNNLRIPPPYPFDIPPPISSLPPQPTSVLRPFLSGIPLPEQIVPKDPNKISITSESNFPLENFNKSFINPSKTKYNPFGSDYHKTKLGSPINNDTESVKETVKKPGPNKPANSFIRPTETTPITKPTYTLVENKDPIYNTSSIPQLNVTTTVATQQIGTSSPNISESTLYSATINITESTPKLSEDSPALNITEKPKLPISLNQNDTLQVISTPTVGLPKKPESPAESSPPLLETSMDEVITPGLDAQKPLHWPDTTSSTSTTPLQTDTNKYYPRPGIVLDDPEYKPGGGAGGLAYRPIVTAPPRQGSTGEVFDVTVTAVQGPGDSNTGQPFIYPDIEGVQVGGGGSGEISVITTAEAGQHFVSIDGKRTYINLFNTSPSVTPTATKKQPVVKQTGTYTVGQVSTDFPAAGTNKRPQFPRRPAHPPVRIDTCIVGDDSTCDKAQNERCRTEVGVSSCHCRPGYSRRKHREPCIRVVSIVMSLRVDRMYDQRLTWTDRLRDKDSPEYLQLEYESSNAIDSAMQMTPFSDEFLGCRVNGLYTVPSGSSGGGLSPVYVNLTLQLEESAETLRPAIKKDIQRHLLGVIHRRSNNIGSSSLWVDSPAGSVSQLQDLDECQHPDLHDCHQVATCSNTFGSFHCSCPEGYRDPWAGNSHHAGRECHTCSPDHCNHRGDCLYHNDQPVCKCAGSYYGAQCEIDGEVLGVAIGASVAAVVIIVSTLVCLCMWSRRWSREQKVAAGMGSPVFGYMATTRNNTIKTPALGSSPYQVSLEDRLRWAQIADVMAQATNHYAPEPGGLATRPSSTIFGYGGTLPHLSAAPVPMPRLSLRPASVHGTRAAESSCSEEEDRTDLLGRNFHVPRPKSRSSVANQSGIYYDVDYEQQPVPTCIPMNTYTMSNNRTNYYCS